MLGKLFFKTGLAFSRRGLRTSNSVFRPNPNPGLLAVTITSASKVVYEGEANSMEVTTNEGVIGVGPQYVQSLVLLTPSVLKVVAPNKTQEFVISAGYMTIHDDSTVYITVNEGVATEDLNKAALEKLRNFYKSTFSGSDQKKQALASVANDLIDEYVKYAK